MDGSSAKKSTSLETLVTQNISNSSELKAKLKQLVGLGKEYQSDVRDSLTALLLNNDQEVVLLSVQAISELAKCEKKRIKYAQENVVHPLLQNLQKELKPENYDIVKQSCRSLGNLCCDCDSTRKLVLDLKGVPILVKLLESTLTHIDLDEIKLLACKTLLNYAIGGKEFSNSIVLDGAIETVNKILLSELDKDDMDDGMVTTALLIISVISDNDPDQKFDTNLIMTTLRLLKETANIEISELCLDHLQGQAEHDSMKTLLAKEGAIELVCSRLEQLIERQDTGDMNASEEEVDSVLKQACDLVIIVLTGDEAMHLLYRNGLGGVYITMVKWLDSTNYNLLTTAVLAIGNFARQDDYCIQMMQDNMYDKMLDIFELYHNFGVRIKTDPDKKSPIDVTTVTKLQHAALSAIRNLTVPVANKQVAAAKGRAANILMNALPTVEDPHVAYKLLAAIRMLVDKQESVCRQLTSNVSWLVSVGTWGASEGGGARGEARRLLAWSLRTCPSAASNVIQAEGCISCIVNMLVTSHSVMQNEAILALTLVSIETLNKKSSESDQQNLEKSYISQLVKSEIGKHISALIESNCAKLPVEVAENLLAFLDITSKQIELVNDYKEAEVGETLRKFSDSRTDLSHDIKKCIQEIARIISDCE